jgi:hypothetical protein
MPGNRCPPGQNPPPVRYDAVPRGTFTDPETDARAAGLDVVVAVKQVPAPTLYSGIGEALGAYGRGLATVIDPAYQGFEKPDAVSAPGGA